MGSTGARIFFPPFIDPWEPNIDPLLTSAVNQLGSYMAAEVLSQGKQGVLIHSSFDAYTPARAYQHYHAGARILSETASARIATPITISEERLGGRRGFDPTARTWNLPQPWPGGDWTLSHIVDYMEAGAMALLSNAARNRRYWLENFYGINKRAVDRWEQWPAAWVIPSEQRNETGLDAVLRILTMGDVEVHVDSVLACLGLGDPTEEDLRRSGVVGRAHRRLENDLLSVFEGDPPAEQLGPPSPQWTGINRVNDQRLPTQAHLPTLAPAPL